MPKSIEERSHTFPPVVRQALHALYRPLPWEQLICSIVITLLLVACSRNEPTPTGSPSPTPPASPTNLPTFTPTPAASSVPRITVVPSATRLQPTSLAVVTQTTATTTGTATPLPTPTPSATPTPRVIDAGTTSTSAPTATLPDSPLPSPTGPASPLGTPSPSAESPHSTSASEASSTPTSTSVATATATPASSPTPTPTPAPEGQDWGFENVYTYYDEGLQEFYVWGEAVNHTDDHQSIDSIWPVVYDENGDPVTTKDDVDAEGQGYKELREGISLAPEQRLAFSFLVYLPLDVIVQDNYEFIIEAEPAEPARDDLEITSDDFDNSEWPDYFYVEGTLSNPGPDLSEYLAIVVTLYDELGHVIGLGWSYEEDTSPLLAAGEHDFFVEVEPWLILYELEIEVYTYKIQLFGY